MAAGLADGVPARGDPERRRLRRVRDPRPVGHRACAPTTMGVHGVPERVPPPRRQGRRGSRARARAGSPARSTGGATAPTATNTFVSQREDVRRAQPAARRHRPHAGALRGVGRVRVDQPRRRRAAVAGSASSRPPPILDAWKVESLRTEWWYACRLPVNWKLAEEAFVEQYHVVRDAPAARHPRAATAARRRGVRPARVRRRRAPLPAHDERGHGRDGARQRRAHRRGPARHRAARRPGAGDGDLAPHAQRRGRRAGTATRGATSPTSTSSRRSGLNEPMGYCFPHYFVLPMYSSASSYRFRPLGPEETLMEIWSLTRFPEGDEPAPADAARGVGVRRSPRGRRSPRRTSRTCRGSSGACTRRASSTCACPSGPRATSRTSSGPSTASSPGFPTSKLLPALREINVNPLERPVVDIGF